MNIYNDYISVIKKVSYDVSTHDDLIMYFYDFLQWIPTYNPPMKIRQTGLNLYAVTLIDLDGAFKALEIFASIVNILKISPEILKLSGGYFYELVDEEDPFSDSNVECIVRSSLKQERLIYQRDNIVEQFEKLANCFKRVIDSNGQLYVLHMGI